MATELVFAPELTEQSPVDALNLLKDYKLSFDDKNILRKTNRVLRAANSPVKELTANQSYSIGELLKAQTFESETEVLMGKVISKVDSNGREKKDYESGLLEIFLRSELSKNDNSRQISIINLAALLFVQSAWLEYHHVGAGRLG